MYKLGNKRLNLWDEPFMQKEEMTTVVRILYLYIVSNALSNVAGVYKISDRRIKFDLCLPNLNLKECFSILRKMKKVYRCGDWIIIKDAPLYIRKMTKSVIKEMDEIIYNLPDKVKEKMKHIHYRYNHLYGEPLHEELQNLGKYDKIKKTKLPIEYTPLFNNFDNLFEDTKSENKLPILKDGQNVGGKNEKDFEEDTLQTNNDEALHINVENPQKHRKDGTDNGKIEQSIKDAEIRKNVELKKEPIGSPHTFFDLAPLANDEPLSTKKPTSTTKAFNAEADITLKKTTGVFNNNPILTQQNSTDNQLKDIPEIKTSFEDANQEKEFSFEFEEKNNAEPFGFSYSSETKTNEKPVNTKDNNSSVQKQKDIELFQSHYAKTVYKKFQSAGLYKGIAYNYFYKVDFLKGINLLKGRAITVEDPKDAYALNEVIDVYLERAKKVKDESKKYFMTFSKMCQTEEYNSCYAEVVIY